MMMAVVEWASHWASRQQAWVPANWEGRSLGMEACAGSSGDQQGRSLPRLSDDVCAGAGRVDGLILNPQKVYTHTGGGRGLSRQSLGPQMMHMGPDRGSTGWDEPVLRPPIGAHEYRL